MSGRIFLIHWHRGEAARHADALRRAGWTVEVEAEDGARAAERIAAEPPDAVVIYLARLPSHGRETAHYLRTRYPPEDLPIVFVGGDEEQVARTRERVPEATFVGEEGLLAALESLAAGPG